MSTGIFLSIRENARPPRLILIKLISALPLSVKLPSPLQPYLSLLGVTFDCTLSFFTHIFFLKAKFSPCFRAFYCTSAYSMDPSKKSLLLRCKAFNGLFSLTLHPNVFFLKATNVTKMKRPVAPSTAACTPFLRLFTYPTSHSRLILPRHLMSRAFVLQPPFPFYVWPDLK